PPPWSLRLRRIEELVAAIVRALTTMRAEGHALDRFPRELERRLETLNELVRAHNAYYPIEANLPRDLRTGGLMDMGNPWEPMNRFSAEALLLLAVRGDSRAPEAQTKKRRNREELPREIPTSLVVYTWERTVGAESGGRPQGGRVVKSPRTRVAA